MKKMISALLIVAAILLATAGNVNAQGGDKDISFIPAKNHNAYVSFISKTSYADVFAASATVDDSMVDTKATVKASKADLKATKANLKTAKANNKALRDFKRLYKADADNASWSFDGDAMVASFENEDVKTNVVYSKSGKWFHTVTYYPEDRTPKEIASIMEYAYPRDDIRLTVKVEEGNMLFYIVQLEDKTTLKKVTVYNDEVNLIEELTKSK